MLDPGGRPRFEADGSRDSARTTGGSTAPALPGAQGVQLRHGDLGHHPRPAQRAPVHRPTEGGTCSLRPQAARASSTLREPLPVLTLALTRNFGCMVGISRRPQARYLTSVRTTNGATPRSSRAYQRPRGLSASPGEGFALDPYEESRSSSPPWCRRGPALLEDDEGSFLSRARRRNGTTTTASATTPPRGGAAWTPAEDLGTTTGAATTGGVGAIHKCGAAISRVLADIDASSMLLVAENSQVRAKGLLPGLWSCHW